MKIINLVLLAIILNGKILIAQTDPFPRNNQSNKIEFVEIFSTEKNKDEFLNQALDVFKRRFTGSEDNINNNLPYNLSATRYGSASGRSKSLITNCGSIENKYRYNITISYKEGKWRYLATDIYIIEGAEYVSKQVLMGNKVETKQDMAKETQLENAIKDIKRCENVWNEFLEDVYTKIQKDINFIVSENNKKDEW
jgi:hypothetical protein